MEADPQLLQFAKSLLFWLGIPSLAGFLALYSAWLAFPPELVIEGVVDKSKRYPSESRIKIKNIGRLPALSIQADVENLCARIGTNTFQNCGFINGPSLVGRLAHSETAEITVSPGIAIGPGIPVSEFSYLLTLKHRAKLFFLTRAMSKEWKVALRVFGDGFTWHVTPA